MIEQLSPTAQTTLQCINMIHKRTYSPLISPTRILGGNYIFFSGHWLQGSTHWHGFWELYLQACSLFVLHCWWLPDQCQLSYQTVFMARFRPSTLILPTSWMYLCLLFKCVYPVLIPQSYLYTQSYGCREHHAELFHLKLLHSMLTLLW